MDGGAQVLKPDEAAIRDFLTRLFGRCEREYPGGWIELRYPSTGGRWESDWFRADKLGIEGATTKTKTVNGNGRNVYVGVNPRNPLTSPFGSGSARDVEIAFVHLIDLDDPAAYKDAKTKAAALPPTFWSITGTVPGPRAHLYWELEEPTRNLAAWTAQQRALAQHFGSDDAIIDPPRIIRVAGTVSYPDKKKSERGYVDELTRAYFFDAATGEVRAPVSSEAVRQAYPGKVHEKEASTAGASGLESPSFNLERGADPMAWVNAIRNEDQRHNNALRLAAHLVATGASDWTITTLLEELLRGRSDGGTVDEIPTLIKSAREKWNTPDPGVKPTPEPQGEFAFGRIPEEFDPTKLERRPWLFGTLMLRRYVSLLVAPGGVGKSLLTIRWALSIVSGRPWGKHVVHKPGPFWIYNAEDDLDELYRRIFGAAKHMGLSQDEWRPRLLVNSGADRRFMVGHATRDGGVVRMPDVDACIEQIKANGVVGASFDPLVETHGANENDNRQIAEVGAMFRDIAQKGNCAVTIVHHTRKPSEASSDGYAGDINTARGAGSLGGLVRVGLTLASMSQADAKMLGIPEEERVHYIRLDSGKANLSAQDPAATWIKRSSVGLGNFDQLGAHEDQVGVLDIVDLSERAAEAARKEQARLREVQTLGAMAMERDEVISSDALASRMKERGLDGRAASTIRGDLKSGKLPTSDDPIKLGKEADFDVVYTETKTRGTYNYISFIRRKSVQSEG